MWAKEVICFECGYRYSRQQLQSCPQCGEEKIYIPSLHSENYDIAKDPGALLKLRIYGVIGFLALLVLTMNLTH